MKILIVRTKTTDTYDSYGSCDTIEIPISVKHQEVSDAEYGELINAVATWNMSHYNDKFKVMKIAEQVEIDTILADYRKTVAEKEKARLLREKTEEERKLERKRKQLEKLKKELGEE